MVVDNQNVKPPLMENRIAPEPAVKFCKDCEFFIQDEFQTEYLKNRYGVCSKSLKEIDRSYELVTGERHIIAMKDQFNHAVWERKHGACGPDGKNFKAMPPLK